MSAHDVPLVAALDIGGTKTAAALVDRTGAVLARASAATPGAHGARAILDTAAGLVAELRAGTPARVAGVGVGSAGVIDPGSGRVLGATDVLAGWAGTDLRGGLASRIGLPVSVVNDVHAHGIGEARYGAGAGHDHVFVLAIGTGIGGSVLMKRLPGGLLIGAHSAAGHAGHVPSPHAGTLPCTCGATGHLEAIAAGPAIVREYQRRTGPGDPGPTDLPDVVGRAHEGDPVARAVLELGGAAVGAAIGGFVNLLDPDLVVVGGGVAQAGELWWSALRSAASDEVLPSLQRVQIVRSKLGGDAALLGAAWLAWEVA